MIDYSNNPIIVGCNYHTIWQKSKSMRFVLSEVNLETQKARLTTRITRKNFWCNISDLIYITTDCNINKAKRLNQ